MTSETPPAGSQERPLELTEIVYATLPSAARQFVDNSMLRDNPPAFEALRFFKVSHKNGDTSFAFIGKILDRDTPEHIGGVIDMRNSTSIGYARFKFLSNSMEANFKEKPLVTYSESFGGYEGQGLHRRRLEIMNILSLKGSGLPLHSDTYRARQIRATSAWKHLVREGKAVEYEEGDPAPGKRFRFKTKDEQSASE